jgi:hypothetical protein
MVIYAVLFLTALAFVVWIVTSSPSGFAFVSLSIGGVVALLLGYQVYAHWRDMRSPLAESEGVVQRIWSRADLVIAWHSFYVTVDRKVFRLQPEDYVQLEDRYRSLSRLDPPVDVYVKIVHFRMTLNVVSVHETLQPIKGAPHAAPPQT